MSSSQRQHSAKTVGSVVTEDQKHNFFNAQNCERCGHGLRIRTTSWFTIEVICMECSRRERKGKQVLLKNKINPDQLEGCGYIPALIRRIVCCDKP